MSFPTDSPLWSALGLAVLHFLWQGLLIGAAVRCLLLFTAERAPERRYALAYGGLIACALCFLATFVLAALQNADLAATSVVPIAAGVTLGTLQVVPVTWSAAPIAAWFWALGAGFMLLRFGVQARQSQRLRHQEISQVSPAWMQTFEALKAQLGVHRGVQMLASGLAEVPMVVGWWRPLILVPTSAFTGLGTDQLSALLAHELAHVRRLDPLLNGLQAILEILLFFHPAVWWLSAAARMERECCCDAAAAKQVGNPRILAEALAALASLSLARPHAQTQLAATGGPLMQRIQRILASESPTGPRTGWGLPLGLTLASLLAVGGGTYAAATPQDVPQGKPLAAPAPGASLELPLVDGQHLTRVRAKLKALVQAGKVTQIEADQRLAALERKLVLRAELKAVEAAQQERLAQALVEQRVAEKSVREARLQQDAARLRMDLEAAVKAGKITSTEARARAQDWLQNAGVQSQSPPPVDELRRELRHALVEGKLTTSEGEQKLEYLRALEQDRALAQEQMRRTIDELEVQLHNGSTTPALARKKLYELRSQYDRLQGQIRQAVPRTQTATPEQVLAQIQAAVEAGRISPSQGKQKIEAYRQALQEQRANYEVRLKEFTAAAQAGKITSEEATKRIEALRKGVQSPPSIERRREYLLELEAALAAGKLTTDQAKERRTRELQRSADAERAEFDQRLKAYLEKHDRTRRLSLGEYARERKAQAQVEQQLARQNALRMELDQLQVAVDAGKLSEEVAAKKIEALREALEKTSPPKKKATPPGAQARQEKVNLLVEQLDAAVAAGKLTAEEARVKLAKLRASLER